MPRTTSARKRSPFGARILGPAEQGPRQLRIRIQLLLTFVLVGTNLLGSGVVFIVNNFAVPAEAPQARIVPHRRASVQSRPSPSGRLGQPAPVWKP